MSVTGADGLVAAVAMEIVEHRHLGGRVGVPERQPHRETVELDVGEREGALEVARVLRGDHEERSGDRAADAVGGDLALLHHLEQRRLGLRAAAVDLVADQHVGEHGALAERERGVVLVVDHDAGDVGGEQVGRELDPLPRAGDRAGDRLGEGGLAGARHVVEQEVALGEQTAEGQADLIVLAAHHLIDVVDQGVHRGRQI